MKYYYKINCDGEIELIFNQSKERKSVNYIKLLNYCYNVDFPFVLKKSINLDEFDKIIDDAFLMTLTDREEKILRLRFGIDNNKEMTLEQLGEVFGLTKERIRQIESNAVNHLKKYFSNDFYSMTNIYSNSTNKKIFEDIFVLDISNFILNKPSLYFKNFINNLNLKVKILRNKNSSLYNLLNLPLEECGFNSRLLSALKNNGYNTEYDLIRLCEFPNKISNIKNIGKKSEEQLLNYLNNLDFKNKENRYKENNYNKWFNSDETVHINIADKNFSKEFYFYTEDVSIISKAIFKYLRENYDLIFHYDLKDEEFMICLQNGWLSKNLLIKHRNDIGNILDDYKNLSNSSMITNYNDFFIVNEIELDAEIHNNIDFIQKIEDSILNNYHLSVQGWFKKIINTPTIVDIPKNELNDISKFILYKKDIQERVLNENFICDSISKLYISYILNNFNLENYYSMELKKLFEKCGYDVTNSKNEIVKDLKMIINESIKNNVDIDIRTYVLKYDLKKDEIASIYNQLIRQSRNVNHRLISQLNIIEIELALMEQFDKQKLTYATFEQIMMDYGFIDSKKDFIKFIKLNNLMSDEDIKKI